MLCAPICVESNIPNVTLESVNGTVASVAPLAITL